MVGANPTQNVSTWPDLNELFSEIFHQPDIDHRLPKKKKFCSIPKRRIKIKSGTKEPLNFSWPVEIF